ncbi:MAG: hypothetical protein M3Z06_13325 [Actinomycetota bacterium]|nr:hypothetical protein [Actinomycetota bacterium]
MSTTSLILLSILEAVVLVAVLGLALLLIRARLQTIAHQLAALAEGVNTVSTHLGLIAPTAPKINAPLHEIVGALPTIAEMAETLAERAER